MMSNSTGAAKCLAVSFVKQTQTPSCAMNIFDLFMSFKYINITGQRNPWLSQAIQNSYLLGHFEPYVLLVGGSEHHLQIVKLSWMRMQLKSPFGFTIESISDASGLLMQRVPQYRTMRLEELICQLIWQNTQSEASCSMDTLVASIHRVYRDLQIRQPSYEAVQNALGALLSAGAVYFSGRGYNLLTADKLAVAKWLENVPEAISLSSDEGNLQDSSQAPLAETEAYSLRLDESLQSWSANVRRSTCDPYATSPMELICNEEQINYESVSPQLIRPGLPSPHSVTFSRPVLPKRSALKPIPAWIQTSHISQPNLSHVSSTNSPTSVSMLAQLPQASKTSVLSVPTQEWTVSCEAAELKHNSNTLVDRSKPRSGRIVHHHRAASVDPLERSSAVNRVYQHCTKPKSLQSSLLQWILNRFRCLRSKWRHENGTETSQTAKVTQSFTKLEQPRSSCVVQARLKSQLIAVPDGGDKPTKLTDWSVPETKGPKSPPSPGRACELKPKYSNFGSLRRCFSLMEDTVVDGRMTEDKPAPAVFSFFPQAGIPPITACQATKLQSVIPIQQSSAQLRHGPQWISHQDLLGSPSYLSLIVRPPSQTDSHRLSLRQLRPPSHSTPRLVIPTTTPENLRYWSHGNHPECNNSLSTQINVLPTRKRLTTRDSGYVESECANPPAQFRDRSAASPMSKSSEGTAFATADTPLWLSLQSQSPPLIWWTTGFQHPIPTKLTSNAAVALEPKYRF
ncbi:uncharacterized protein DEA37_0000579 [Paragonimus westermani]|uniref:Winged helix Storkhead-box1 domain-containing protein n=1 Tax=Paragonimus westermani TaxID=34504 RepID=A0A5J4NHF8_9TREM|nr:uncharacterized protein DEA37_0000579 [Paragonimus westermani]